MRVDGPPHGTVHVEEDCQRHARFVRAARARLDRIHRQGHGRTVANLFSRQHRDSILPAVVVQEARTERGVVLRCFLQAGDLIDMSGACGPSIDFLQQDEVGVGRANQ